jgi:hypothetical protein
MNTKSVEKDAMRGVQSFVESPTPKEIEEVEETLKKLNTPELTDIIEIEISERARQTAEHFCRTGTCLIASELKIRGYQGINAGTRTVLIGKDNIAYQLDTYCDIRELKFRLGAMTKPYYDRSVVGKKITMRRVK